jgi:hypothetical protein
MRVEAKPAAQILRGVRTNLRSGSITSTKSSEMKQCNIFWTNVQLFTGIVSAKCKITTWQSGEDFL